MSFSKEGKAEFRAIVAKKLGANEEAVSAFVRRAKSKYKGKEEVIRAIKEDLRAGRVADAKARCLTRAAAKLGVDEERLSSFVSRAKAGVKTKSVASFKDRLRTHLQASSGY